MTTLTEAPAFDQARYDAGDFTGIIETLDKTGDTKTIWDKGNPTEVGIAEATFKAAKKAGALIYKAVGKKGEKGEQVTEFNPEDERLIIVPQLVGG